MEIMSDVTEVVPRVFIGNSASSRDSEFFKRYRISHVVNITEKEPNAFENSGVSYFNAQFADACDTDISVCFEESSEFISHCLAVETNALLVHCKCGVSRSSTIVLSYLISRKGMSLNDGLLTLRSKRRRVRPNAGFFLQLLRLERTAHGQKGNGDAYVPSILPHVYLQLPEETWRLMMKISLPAEIPESITKKQFKLLSKLVFRGRRGQKRAAAFVAENGFKK